MNILVVDDELGLRHTLTLILEGEGHQIRSASDGAQALAMLAEEEADLVLCDVRMPALDGLDFLDRYRRESGLALVIMMSAYGDDDAALDAMKRGAYDFIQKPFRADQVILTLNKAFEREGLRRQVESLEEQLAALQAPSDLSVKRHIAALERRLIARALERTNGNRTRAAKLLELSPRALLYKIKEYGLE
jgi:two-component system response regulator AtoC